MNKKQEQPSRAWIEINSKNLIHNILQIKSVIPTNCQIMAVIKANAYGHGMLETAKILSEIGISNFAVATIEEALKLRQAGIKEEILMLSATAIEEDIKLEQIIKYDLIQTIVDYDYAKKISKLSLKEKIKAHLKVNTGMNRLGENYKNIDNIKKIYNLKKIQILGVYTHLCVSDNREKEAINFTNQQITNFYNLIDNLTTSGYNVGKIHFQASYGILNYPNLKCDYVRPGIIMYGINSSKNNSTVKKISLKPVLSLKARITSIKEIDKNESVGYSRLFTAQKKMKIATISIGYADGYPCALSLKKAKVLINKQYAEVIGRICMDQLMIDVSNIKKLNQGSIVTLIGERKFISAEEIAEKAGLSSYELLSRLGNRLKRIVIK